LAGCEATWQAAKRGISVTLYEMRPKKTTGAHRTSALAEIICSNSLGSKQINRASGLLAHELRLMDSLLLSCAEKNQVPAGQALAVDRNAFSQSVTETILNTPNISVIREEITQIPPSPTIIATGPLTSECFAEAICRFTGQENLFFFDAVAPIVEFDSINMGIAFWGSRYEKSENKKGDYINCPFNKEEYESFIHELLSAERIDLRAFESDISTGVRTGKGPFFEACLPIEILAARGINTLAYGPLRPVGFHNAHAGKRPYAVVQLRQDNQAGSAFNLVGFQTNLKYLEQERVFRMIPGLGKADFLRYGQMHRNTYIYSPDVLRKNLQVIHNPMLFIAGQITGVEGYLANIATGLLAGINASQFLKGQDLIALPETTMTGALCNYISTPNKDNFQPMKANFGLFPPLDLNIRSKSERFQAYSDRAIASLTESLRKINEI